MRSFSRTTEKLKLCKTFAGYWRNKLELKVNKVRNWHSEEIWEPYSPLTNAGLGCCPSEVLQYVFSDFGAKGALGTLPIPYNHSKNHSLQTKKRIEQYIMATIVAFYLYIELVAIVLIHTCQIYFHWLAIHVKFLYMHIAMLLEILKTLQILFQSFSKAFLWFTTVHYLKQLSTKGKCCL